MDSGTFDQKVIDLYQACEAMWDNFISRGGDPESLLGIQVRAAMNSLDMCSSRNRQNHVLSRAYH